MISSSWSDMRQRLLMGFVLPVWGWFWLWVLTDCDTKTFATDFFSKLS
jgi:hypothetical protein